MNRARTFVAAVLAVVIGGIAMPVPFQRAIFGASSALTVELGFGADLTADPATWPWTDVSADVMYAPGIDTVHGQADETSKGQPASCAFDLLNIANLYSYDNPMCANYPNVVEGTPVRVRRTSGAGVTNVEFQGRATGFSPGYDETGKWTVTHVSAFGRLQQLGAGKAVPFKSPLRRTAQLATQGQVAYWPLEGPQTNPRLPDQMVTGGPTLRVQGTVAYPAYTPENGPLGADGMAGSGPVADLSPGGYMVAKLPTITATSYRFEVVAGFPAGAFSAADFGSILSWDLNSVGSGIDTWEIDATDAADGGLYIQWEFNGGASSNLYATNLAFDDGLLHHIRVDVSKVGANQSVTMALDGKTVIPLTATGRVWSTPIDLAANPSRQLGTLAPQIGHLTYWAPFTTCVGTGDTAWAARGYLGELAHVRFARICAEGIV